MRYGTIPSLNKPVSRLICGTATRVLLEADNPSASRETKEAAFLALDTVFAAGINTFDCAAIYGETVLGEWMALRGNRDRCVIFSKCAHPNAWRHRVNDFDILTDLHDALVKLRTDAIDVYLLHRDCKTTPVSTVIDTLNRLYEQGKIKCFGVSNWTQERIEEANDYALCHRLVPLSVSSPQFSLAEQIADPYNAGFSDPCVSLSDRANRASRAWYAATKMPLVAYSPLAHGYFSGRFTSRDNDKTVASRLDGSGNIGYRCDRNRERLARCETLAKKKQITVSQIALAWLFSQPMEVYAVIGASANHLADNLDALDLTLTAEECAWLDLETDTLPSL